MAFEEWWEKYVASNSVTNDSYIDSKASWEAGYVVGMEDVPTAEYEPPEGYVLVPVEPTDAMLQAAQVAPMPTVWLDSITAQSNLSNKTIYKAMIQVAQ